MEKRIGRPKTAKIIDVVCDTCGKKFQKKECYCKLSKTGKLFCSRKCFYQWNNKNLSIAGIKALKKYRFNKQAL